MKIHPKLRQVICVWLALFPTLLIFNFLFSDLLANFHPVLRIFITSIIVVPIMVLFLIPLSIKIISKWLK